MVLDDPDESDFGSRPESESEAPEVLVSTGGNLPTFIAGEPSASSWMADKFGGTDAGPVSSPGGDEP